MRIQWTASARLLAASAGLAWLLGLVLGAVGLTLFGIAMALLLLVDGMLMRQPGGHCMLQVSATRVHESDRVSVAAELAGAAHFRIPLPDSCEVLEGSAENDGRGAGLRFVMAPLVRGQHRIGPAQVRSWSPLRLWAAESAVGQSMALCVVPRAEELEEAIASRVPRLNQGRHMANRPGSGFDFFSLRAYASGDTQRSVNWKATAKNDELIVNQRQLEPDAVITFFLDHRTVSGLGAPGATPLDRSCRVAMALVADALAARDTVRFISYGSDIEVLRGSGASLLFDIEDHLSRVRAAGTRTLEDAWRHARSDLQAKGPIVVLTSAELDGTLKDVASSMANSGFTVHVVSPMPEDDLETGMDRQSARQAALTGLRGQGARVHELRPHARLAAW